MHIWYSQDDFDTFGNTKIYQDKNGNELIGTAAMLYYDPTAYSWKDKKYLGEGDFVRFGSNKTISDYVAKIYKK